MAKEFNQLAWDEHVQADLRQLLQLAVREDSEEAGDWTTAALVPEQAVGRAVVVVREPGVIAGMPAAEMALQTVDPRIRWRPEIEDGQSVEAGDPIARVEGPARGLLTAERLALNLLGRLSGVATLTRQYVDTVAGTGARIYDTRKTTPGWRRLEKYAVRCGGGWNHRTGLFDAVLIKDNHLAVGMESGSEQGCRYTPAEAVLRDRRFVEERAPETARGRMIIEVEVDTLEQLDDVLSAEPDVVLLDNMSPDRLREAVARRDAASPTVELEASGGVSLRTVRAIAASGVERVSVGALTRSAVCLDIALDWLSGDARATSAFPGKPA